VGSLGLITNLFIFYVSINFLKLNLNISSVIAFIFAAFQNYIFNSKWTFVKSNKKIRFKTYIKYLISSLIGLGSNLIILNTVVFIFGENAKFFGQLFGVLSGSIFNYLFSKYFVFEMKK
jgi:putative flippase GtrA